MTKYHTQTYIRYSLIPNKKGKVSTYLLKYNFYYQFISSLTTFTRELVLLRCWIGTVLGSLVVPIKYHCSNGAILFWWSLTFPMESHCSDGGASFQQNLVLLAPWSLPYVTVFYVGKVGRTVFCWSYYKNRLELSKWSYKMPIIDLKDINYNDRRSIYVFFQCILQPKYMQLHEIGPHCVMSDNLLRSSPCYRPNTITLMALALIR